MKKIVALLLCAALVFVLVACGGTTDPPAPDSAYYKEGVEFLNKGDYDKAVESFNKAIAEQESAAAYIGRGDAYVGLENAESALADYTRAIELNGGAQAYLGAANANIMLGRFDEALAVAVEGAKKTSSAEIDKKKEELEAGNAIDSKGREHKISRYDSDGDLVWYHVTEYDSTGRAKNRTAYNASGIMTSSYPYVYDAAGNMLESSWFFSRDGVLMLRTSKYDDQNRVIEVTGHGNDYVATNRSLIRYGADGRKNEETYYPNVEKADFYLITYEWTDFGKLSLYTRYTNGTELESSTAYEYDDKQQNTKVLYYDENNALEYYYTYEYDADGNKTVERRYDADGNLTDTTNY